MDPMSEPGPAPLLPVLINERAGGGGDGVRRVAEALRDAGVPAVVRPVDPPRLAAAVARAAERAAERAPVVGVCGGDGTLRTAAGVLAGSHTALAPFPTGTLNHFARRLGFESVEDTARALAAGRTTTVPVGVADDRVFLNTATFGLYADVVRRRERLRPWLRKWPAAAVAFTLRIVRMRRLEVVLDVEGERLRRRTPLVWVGMGWGSFPRVHQAPEGRGAPELEIVVLRPPGRFGIVSFLARMGLHLLHGRRPVRDPALEVLHARRVLVSSRRRVGITLDGEVARLAPPVFVSVRSGALRVVAPADGG